MMSPNTSAALMSRRSLSRLSTSSSRSSPRLAGRDSSNVRFTASTKSLNSGGSVKSSMRTPRHQSERTHSPLSTLHLRPVRGGSIGSISTLSHSTKQSSGKKCPAKPKSASRTKRHRTTKQQINKKQINDDDDDGDYDDDDDDDDDNDGTQNKNGNNNDGNEDFVPTTSAAESPTVDLDNDNPVLQEMIEKHRTVFMSHAFPPALAGGTNLTDIQLWCRPQEELDYIVFVLSNWQPNVNLKTMEPGPEREHLTSSRRNIT